MTIIPDARKMYFDSRQEEAELAEALNEAFDVSFAKTHGDLAFWIANPTPRTRERFGLQKEVLVLYSPHPVTDARVLTAIEQAPSEREPRRAAGSGRGMDPSEAGSSARTVSERASFRPGVLTREETYLASAAIVAAEVTSRLVAPAGR